MDLQKELNHNQYLAASSKSQYLRIIAGAGTGKTRTLTYRLAYQILTGTSPRRMLAITFTNKAANEMATRVGDLLEKENFPQNGKPLICTFHGFCYRFLKKEIGVVDGYSTTFQIAGEDESGSIFKDIFKKMQKGESKEFVQSVTRKIASLKTDGVFPNEVSKSDVPLDVIYTFDELMEVYKTYQKKLKLQNLLDFDDLLMITAYIMENHADIKERWRRKYDVFLVDEFQDTNYLQYALVKDFMSKSASLTVVGDPDQTIYTWRGAKNDIIKDRLQQDFPNLETVILDENYRSTQAILDAANVLINHNTDRMDKKLIAASGKAGEKVEFMRSRDNDNEAYRIAYTIRKLNEQQNVPYQDIAIIYRSNYLSNSLEKQLTLFRIPYEIYGGLKFYERAEIKDAIAYLRLAINPDDFSFKRTLSAPTKGVGEVTLQKAEELRLTLGEEIPLVKIFKDHQDILSLNKKSILALQNFYIAFDKFTLAMKTAKTGDEILSAIQDYFNETGFLSYVHSEDVKLQEKLSYTAASSVSKTDNVIELQRTISQFFQQDILDEDGNPKAPSLEDFLLEVALQSDQDTMEDTPKVSLMTGHVSKGLEFPYVFITGLNQLIFPTSHALQDGRKGAIEEERRLMYVCMTRAKQKLYLSTFGGKNFRTNSEYQDSMFLQEVFGDSQRGQSENKTTPQKPRVDYNAYQGVHRPSLRDNLTSNVNALLKKTAPSGNTKDTYVVGDRVLHTSFGIGKVIEILPGGKIKVEFKDPYGTKTMVPGFKAFRKMREDE